MQPKAIICDIDGTIAKMNGRSPFDWGNVDKDTRNEPIYNLVQYLFEDGFVDVIIFVSGRDSVCEDATREWLRKNGLPTYYLYMRPEGNNEKDTVIKRRLYEEHIKDRFDIKFVLDDRDQVVAMWRSLGLTCLQVEDGNF